MRPHNLASLHLCRGGSPCATTMQYGPGQLVDCKKVDYKVQIAKYDVHKMNNMLYRTVCNSSSSRKAFEGRCNPRASAPQLKSFGFNVH